MRAGEQGRQEGGSAPAWHGEGFSGFWFRVAVQGVVETPIDPLTGCRRVL